MRKLTIAKDERPEDGRENVYLKDGKIYVDDKPLGALPGNPERVQLERDGQPAREASSLGPGPKDGTEIIIDPAVNHPELVAVERSKEVDESAPKKKAGGRKR